MSSKVINELFRSSIIKSNSILMASFRLLFVSVVLAVLCHFAMLCFPGILLPEVSLAVSLGFSSARTGETSKSSEPQCNLVWSYQKMLARESLFRIWRRDFFIALRGYDFNPCLLRHI